MDNRGIDLPPTHKHLQIPGKWALWVSDSQSAVQVAVSSERCRDRLGGFVFSATYVLSGGCQVAVRNQKSTGAVGRIVGRKIVAQRILALAHPFTTARPRSKPTSIFCRPA